MTAPADARRLRAQQVASTIWHQLNPDQPWRPRGPEADDYTAAAVAVLLAVEGERWAEADELDELRNKLAAAVAENDVLRDNERVLSAQLRTARSERDLALSDLADMRESWEEAATERDRLAEQSAAPAGSELEYGLRRPGHSRVEHCSPGRARAVLDSGRLQLEVVQRSIGPWQLAPKPDVDPGMATALAAHALGLPVVVTAEGVQVYGEQR